jgi:MFS family permease
MEPNFRGGESKSSFGGATGLIVAAGVVGILLIALPAYRWFFLISVGIGLVVAGILFLWYRFRPVREKDIENNKRPLGLG